MIKAIFIQRISGTCMFFRIFDLSWKKKRLYSVLEGYFSAITTTVSEFGEIAPYRIYFDNGDLIYYAQTNKYVLGIVSNRNSSEAYLSQIGRLFIKNFGMICSSAQKTKLLPERDEECIKKEKKVIGRFSRSLNLLVSKKDIVVKQGLHEKKECNSEPLMISDVDLLISSVTGQPIYLMLSLNMLYEPTIFISFISAIQELGKKLGLGLVSEIKGKNFVVYVKTSENVLSILIAKNTKRRYIAYQQFLNFASEVCENWLKEHNISSDAVSELFEKRKEIEDLIKLLVDTDAWELHQIKEKERDLLASKTLNVSF